MTMRAHGLTPILNVSNLEDTFAWFQKLGWRKAWDWGDPPDFGAVDTGGLEIFLCEGCQGAGATWMSVWVEDVDAIHAHCVAQGLEVTHPPTDEPWNVREMHVRHPDGHVFRFGCPMGDFDAVRDLADPPLPIERVDVPVRLEKRLAALLHDLAQHKGMTVSSCLEETLLHTFEPIGHGVASPHTPKTLDHIRELKARHGIDYDCHASYRFVEP